MQIDFWYSIGSTYSYLTVMRLSEIERASGIDFRWRPFNVRHVMIEQNNIPFKDKPVKTEYMWRDIERRANQRGLAPSIPAPYPLPGLVVANQIATLGVEQGWVKDYTRATYRRWFEDGKPAGEEPNISESLEEIAATFLGSLQKRWMSNSTATDQDGPLIGRDTSYLT